MNPCLGLIGDVHGDVDRLEVLLRQLRGSVERLVFLGDYVNRGRFSRQVIDLLLQLDGRGFSCTFLEGNHDAAFRDVLRGGSMDAFIQMGGAATIRSYIADIGHDWERAFRAAVPPEHHTFLESLQPAFRLGDELLATHAPAEASLAETFRYTVSGHRPQGTGVPLIGDTHAHVDTGCGTFDDGRLTCLLWPSRDWVQA